MKKCKLCKKTGIFLKLNEQELCKECRRDNSRIIDDGDFVDVLVDYTLGDNRAERKIEQSRAARDNISKRQGENFDILYDKYKEALAFERCKELGKALRLYLEILPYQPEGTDYYKRPCIILERSKEYEKAIEICDQAIACFSGLDMPWTKGAAEEFEHRRSRLYKKLNLQK